MKTRRLCLVAATLLAGCVRSPCPPKVARGNDTSIVMPRFFEQPATALGAAGQQYEFDGPLFRALMIASNDYLPPGGENRPCWQRPEGHRYRVIHQGDIIFVHIEDDPELCGLQYISLDSGVMYAISTDGRILRRVLGSDPEAALFPEPPQSGGQPPPGGENHVGPAPLGPPAGMDAGAGASHPEPPPSAPSLPDGGTPPLP